MRISTRPSVLLAATSVCVGGCTGILNRAINVYEEEVDISTATGNDNVAVIRGSAGSILLASWDCWISHPVETKKLTVDPGFLSINFSCDVTGDRVRSTGFYLEFLAGHSYDYKMFSDCAGIVDSKTKQTVADTCVESN